MLSRRPESCRQAQNRTHSSSALWSIRRQKSCAWLLILWITLAALVAGGRDYYDILGVDRRADTATIKRAFRKLAMRYHPDKNPGDKNAEELYVEASSAHDVLSDEGKRRRYDMYGEEGLRGGEDEGGFRDPFEEMFGGFFGRGSRSRRDDEETEKRGPDITVPLTVTLEQLYNGAIIEAAHKRQVVCTSWSDCEKTCDMCRGLGYVTQTRRLGPGFVEQRQVHCPKCGGRGKVMSQGECKGCPKGQFEEMEKLLMIDIEKGMDNGQKIDFEGQADEIADHTPGTLAFILDTEPHKRFARKGNDLHHQLTISLAEALVGVDRVVEQLDGRMVPIITKEVIKPNDQAVIKGEGMPALHSSTVGDMIVEFWVEFPDKLSDEQRTAVISLLGQPPRASQEKENSTANKSMKENFEQGEEGKGEL